MARNFTLTVSGAAIAASIGGSTVSAEINGATTEVFETEQDVVVNALNRARIFADYSQKNSAGTAVKNLNAAAEPTANLVPFPTGGIVNEVPNVNIVLTNNYQGTATRIVTSGTNRNFYAIRLSSFTPTPASGTIGFRFRLAGTVGAGNGQNLTIFYPGGSSTPTVDEISSGSADVATEGTEFSVDFTYSGAGDVYIRFPDDGTDVLIDALQIYEGGVAAMPDWADEVHGGVRKAIAHASSLTTDANGAVDTESDTSGLIAIDPAFPAEHTYSALTVLEVRSVKAGTSAGHMVNLSKQDGGATINIPLQVDGGVGYVGEINTTLEGNTRSSMAANLTGHGVFVSGVRIDATARSMIVHGIPAVTDEVSWAGYSTSRFMLGSYSNTAVADQRANTALGKHVFTVIWDEALTDSELVAVSQYLHALAEQRGNTMAPSDEWQVFSGDSNATRGTDDWTQLITADGYMTGDNLQMSNTSVGGHGLPHLERDYAGSEGAGAGMGLTDETITENGRFGATDKPILVAAAAKSTRRVLYNLPIITNDTEVLEAYSGTVEEQAAAYTARLQAFILHVLDQTPDNVDVMWYTGKPQNEVTWPDWEDHRAYVNAAMIAWAATQSRVYICDSGGSSTIGDPANQAIYFAADKVHFITAGDTEKAANIAKPAIEAWRAAA